MLCDIARSHLTSLVYALKRDFFTDRFVLRTSLGKLLHRENHVGRYKIESLCASNPGLEEHMLKAINEKLSQEAMVELYMKASLNMFDRDSQLGVRNLQLLIELKNVLMLIKEKSPQVGA